MRKHGLPCRATRVNRALLGLNAARMRKLISEMVYVPSPMLPDCCEPAKLVLTLICRASPCGRILHPFTMRPIVQ